MAFPVEPDNELTYVPTPEDETAESPETDLETSDNDPNVLEPDEADTAATPVEDDGSAVPEDTESGDYSIDTGYSEEPEYAQIFGQPLEADAPEVDQDAGDLYSASALSPDDTEFANAPETVAPNVPVEDLDYWESQTTEDFETEEFGVAIEDGAIDVPVSYEIQGREPDGAWQTLATVSAAEVTTEVRGLPTGEGWTFRIRAVFVTGEVGAWSAETSIDLPVDMIAPPTPTAPSVKAERGIVTISWDGLGADASEQPVDYKHTVVWVSETGDPSTFTPIGLLFGAGEFPWTNASYNVNYFFALSSLDLTGNSSARSVATPATLKPLVEEPDIQAELDRIDQETGGLITEAGQLNDRLAQAETDIEAAEANLNTLTNTTLPALQSDLDANETAVNTLKNTTIPVLQSDLDANEATVNTLKNTTVPNLATRLGEAEGDLATAKTDLNGRLDQAFVEVGQANTAATNAKTAADSAQASANTALSDAASAAGIANGKGKVLVQSTAPGAADRNAVTLWIDTTGGANTPKRWVSGTTWTAVTDKTATDAASAAVQAQTAANNAKTAADNAQATANSAVTSASNAQTAADAARTYAQDQVALLVAQGTNLVRNGGFEAGDVGWQMGEEVSITTDNPRTGTQALQIKAPTANRWPKADPVASSTGRSYYVEYWVREGGAPDNLKRLGAVAQAFTTSGSSASYIFAYTQSADIPNYTYTKVSGITTINLADTVRVQFAPWAEGGTTSSYNIDDFLAVDVTEAQEALAAAATAQARADAAHTLAGTAKSTADNALTMAGSKSVVMYSTQAPSGTASPGDTWRRVDSSGNVIAEWRMTNSGSWLSQQITSDVISNLDVGKLTVGTAAISNAVIDKLWADVISARKILADQIVIGEGENLVSWPASLSAPNNQIPHIQYFGGPNTSEVPGWQSGAGVVEGNHIFVQRADITPGSDTNALTIGTKPRTGVNGGNGWDVEPEEWFQFSAYVKLGGTYTDGAPTARFGLYWYTTAGSLISANLGVATPVTWAWNKLTVDGKAPATAAKLVVYLRYDKPGGVRVDLPALYRKKDGGLIVTGSITGDHLEVNSVSAAVANVISLNASRITSGTINTARLNASEISTAIANIISLNASRITAGTINTARLNTSEIAAATASIQKADVANLTASSATMSSAVIDKLWADVVNAKKITADMLVIGAGNNLIPNARLTSSDGWSGWGRNASNGPGGQPSIWGLGSKNLYSSYFDLEAGKRYRFEVQAMAQKAGSRFYAQIITTGGSTNPYVVNAGLLSTGWKSFSGEFVAPAGTVAGRINIYLNHSSGTSTDGYQWYTDWGLYPMASGELIVDGAITAGKIAAKTITAAELATNAVTADKINGGAIDGMLITGATVRTSSSSTRMEMTSNSLGAWKDGTQFFNINPSTATVWMDGSFQSTSLGGLLGNTPYFVQMGKDANGDPGIFMAATVQNYRGNIMPTTTGMDMFVHAKDSTGVLAPNFGLKITGQSGPTSMYGGFRLWYNDLHKKYPTSYDMSMWYALSLQHWGGTSNPPVITLYDSYDADDPNQIPRLTSGDPLHFDVSGGSRRLGLSSSLSRYKLNQRVIPEDYDDRILSLDAKTWFDKTQAEDMAEMMRPQTAEEASDSMTPLREGESNKRPFILRRTAGVIAEDVRDAGLDEFLTYGLEEMTGVRYDRLGVALIPVVRRQRDRIASLEDKVDDLEAKLEALLARVESLETSKA